MVVFAGGVISETSALEVAFTIMKTIHCLAAFEEKKGNDAWRQSCSQLLRKHFLPFFPFGANAAGIKNESVLLRAMNVLFCETASRVEIEDAAILNYVLSMIKAKLNRNVVNDVPNFSELFSKWILLMPKALWQLDVSDSELSNSIIELISFAFRVNLTGIAKNDVAIELSARHKTLEVVIERQFTTRALDWETFFSFIYTVGVIGGTYDPGAESGTSVSASAVQEDPKTGTAVGHAQKRFSKAGVEVHLTG
ncbi:hypothetical protein HK101_006214 [Irineochytrium annulatum]|nr:hypothetical protein HK101_006214 [Irineochytrium annulatum]